VWKSLIFTDHQWWNLGGYDEYRILLGIILTSCSAWNRNETLYKTHYALVHLKLVIFYTWAAKRTDQACTKDHLDESQNLNIIFLFYMLRECNMLNEMTSMPALLSVAIVTTEANNYCGISSYHNMYKQLVSSIEIPKKKKIMYSKRHIISPMLTFFSSLSSLRVIATHIVLHEIVMAALSDIAERFRRRKTLRNPPVVSVRLLPRNY
jgi:hypothetical protein